MRTDGGGIIVCPRSSTVYHESKPISRYFSRRLYYIITTNGIIIKYIYNFFFLFSEVKKNKT